MEGIVLVLILGMGITVFLTERSGMSNYNIPEVTIKDKGVDEVTAYGLIHTSPSDWVSEGEAKAQKEWDKYLQKEDYLKAKAASSASPKLPNISGCPCGCGVTYWNPGKITGVLQPSKDL